jgi:hypothetical protein
LKVIPAKSRIGLCTILKCRFTDSETARLVGLLLQKPRWNHEKIIGLKPEWFINNALNCQPLVGVRPLGERGPTTKPLAYKKP